ncbi:MAG TPA: hypothetical protein VIS49_10455, partial [Cyclobacteriaceae bacterium]
MRQTKLVLIITTLISLPSFGQAKLRKLPSTINHPAINVYSPYISLDGNTLVFISDNSDENQLTLFYTVKKDAVNWKEPVMLPKTVNNQLNFLGGFALSSDGKTLYISSLKSGGLGGFDILVSPLKGTVWAEPRNLGLPINSREHEACPSLTPDESVLYFMRCSQMDQRNASGCKILVTKKSRLGRWEEPVELPSFINTGNSQTPRIMGDGETLLFSSDQFPNNKGGMDLYVTKLNGSEWSKPVPLDFANTPKNDQYVSAAAQGRYLLKDQPGQRSSEIAEMLFTDDVKPKAAVKMEGSVAGISDPGSPYVAVFDQSTQKSVFNGRPDKNGDFTFYLKEGAIYDISVEPQTDDFTFYSKVFDFTGDRVPMFEQVNATLNPIAKGTELELAIDFETYTSRITESSAQELRRLARLVKGNASQKFSIDVSLTGYMSDSVKSSPDLTQLRIDTVHFAVEKQIQDTVRLDSLLLVMNKHDSLRTNRADSTIVYNDEYFEDQMDSIRRIAFKTILVDSIGLKYTYHNDRTELQANAVLDYLIKDGASSQNIKLNYSARPEAIAEKRKTIV